MYVLGTHRTSLLDCMPNHSVVAEIGVAEGDFSQQILHRTLPRKVHLIDPWVHQDDHEYRHDPNNVPQSEADLRYHAIHNRFDSFVEAGLVEIHREFSQEAAGGFEDGYFDWVYIDAQHTYESCLRDLRKFDPKVKEDGFICGHDYANHDVARQMDFGVVEAVNEFVAETGYEFLLLTHEVFPSYVIAKDPSSPKYKELLSAAAAKCPILIEIDQPELMSYQVVVVTFEDGHETFHYRFS